MWLDALSPELQDMVRETAQTAFAGQREANRAGMDQDRLAHGDRGALRGDCHGHDFVVVGGQAFLQLTGSAGREQ